MFVNITPQQARSVVFGIWTLYKNCKSASILDKI